LNSKQKNKAYSHLHNIFSVDKKLSATSQIKSYRFQAAYVIYLSLSINQRNKAYSYFWRMLILLIKIERCLLRKHPTLFVPK